MSIENKRKEAIELLASLVVESNVECYKNIVADESHDYAKSIKDDFANYGVDVDTVSVILGDMNSEVAERVAELQKDPVLNTLLK